jgi:hypothetical protein
MVVPAHAGARLRLMPGHNDVSDATFEKVKDTLAKYVERGSLEVVAEKVETPETTKGKARVKTVKVEEPKSFADLDEAEAEKVVTDTWDIPTLRKWLDSAEGSVRSKIHAQIELIEEEKGEEPKTASRSTRAKKG